MRQIQRQVTDSNKIMVYVVDDDDSILQAIDMLLQSANMDVRTFNTSEKFLQHNPENISSCIISDIKIRDLDGFDFYKKLREKGINIPVIFLSAFDSKKYRQHARQIGAAGYLSKPVDDQALIDTIHWAISKE